MEMATCDGCDGCGLRCMDGFGVSEIEYDAVRAYRASLPPGDVKRIDDQPKTVPWPGADGLDISVTYCRFRDMERGNCSVYPARPTICRIFGHTEWLPCPIDAVTAIPDGAATVWNDYRGFERRTWAEWDRARGIDRGTAGD
jgi:hypothetical protein